MQTRTIHWKVPWLDVLRHIRWSITRFSQHQTTNSTIKSNSHAISAAIGSNHPIHLKYRVIQISIVVSPIGERMPVIATHQNSIWDQPLESNRRLPILQLWRGTWNRLNLLITRFSWKCFRLPRLMFRLMLHECRDRLYVSGSFFQLKTVNSFSDTRSCGSQFIIF